MYKSIYSKIIGSIAFIAILTGCGGGSSSPKETSQPQVTLEKGYYVDSGIVGVNYTCGSHSGVTGEGGVFEFEQGDSCTFSIGGVTIRTVSSANLHNNVYILEDKLPDARVLQTLDVDGNATNGLEIPKGAAECVNTVFGSNIPDPVTDTDITALHTCMASNISGYTGVAVSEDDARKHINQTIAQFAPVAIEQNLTTPEDTPKNIILSATDPNDDSLTYSVIDNPMHGTLSGTAPNLIYTPNLNFDGNDTFTFKASDGSFDSNVTKINIEVTPVNDSPVAADDNITFPEDSNSGYIDVLVNDSDPDGDTLTVSLGSNPGGTMTIHDNKILWTPVQNYYGQGSFTYHISDGHGGTATGTVHYIVTPVNDVPVANDMNVSTNEDHNLTITLDASDVDGDALTPIIVATNHGTVNIVNNLNVTYIPSLNYNGVDTFTYKVKDGNNTESAVKKVTINVIPENDPPVVPSGFEVNVTEDNNTSIHLIASDVDGDPLNYQIHQPVHGTLQGEAPDFTYIPNTNYFGEDSFTYIANDGHTDSINVAEVVIHIAPVNDVPIANDDNVTILEDKNVTINVVNNDEDVDHDTLTVTAVGNPGNGIVVNNHNGTVTYAPNANYNGEDSFNYTISDGNTTATAMVNITVTAVNDAPIANDDNVTVDEDNSTVIDVLSNDSDIEGDNLSVVAIAPATNGNAVLDTDGNITYTPNPDYYGTDSFNYTVSDGNLSSTATVHITITAENDAPVANDDNVTALSATATIFTVLANDTDPENDPLTITQIITPPNHGNATISNSGHTINYTSDNGYDGNDILVYEISDGNDTAQATVFITVSNREPYSIGDLIDQNLSQVKLENHHGTQYAVFYPYKFDSASSKYSKKYWYDADDNETDTNYLFKIQKFSVDYALASNKINVTFAGNNKAELTSAGAEVLNGNVDFDADISVIFDSSTDRKYHMAVKYTEGHPIAKKVYHDYLPEAQYTDADTLEYSTLEDFMHDFSVNVQKHYFDEGFAFGGNVATDNSGNLIRVDDNTTVVGTWEKVEGAVVVKPNWNNSCDLDTYSLATNNTIWKGWMVKVNCEEEWSRFNSSATAKIKTVFKNKYHEDEEYVIPGSEVAITTATLSGKKWDMKFLSRDSNISASYFTNSALKIQSKETPTVTKQEFAKWSVSNNKVFMTDEYNNVTDKLIVVKDVGSIGAGSIVLHLGKNNKDADALKILQVSNIEQVILNDSDVENNLLSMASTFSNALFLNESGVKSVIIDEEDGDNGDFNIDEMQWRVNEFGEVEIYVSSPAGTHTYNTLAFYNVPAEGVKAISYEHDFGERNIITGEDKIYVSEKHTISPSSTPVILNESDMLNKVFIFKQMALKFALVQDPDSGEYVCNMSHSNVGDKGIIRFSVDDDGCSWEIDKGNLKIDVMVNGTPISHVFTFYGSVATGQKVSLQNMVNSSVVSSVSALVPIKIATVDYDNAISDVSSDINGSVIETVQGNHLIFDSDGTFTRIKIKDDGTTDKNVLAWKVESNNTIGLYTDATYGTSTGVYFEFHNPNPLNSGAVFMVNDNGDSIPNFVSIYYKIATSGSAVSESAIENHIIEFEDKYFTSMVFEDSTNNNMTLMRRKVDGTGWEITPQKWAWNVGTSETDIYDLSFTAIQESLWTQFAPAIGVAGSIDYADGSDEDIIVKHVINLSIP